MVRFFHNFLELAFMYSVCANMLLIIYYCAFIPVGWSSAISDVDINISKEIEVHCALAIAISKKSIRHGIVTLHTVRYAIPLSLLMLYVFFVCSDHGFGVSSEGM